jgi:hypothetical protein
MQSFKIFIIKSLIFLGQKTFFGRGKLRRLLIKIIRSIIFNNFTKNSIPKDFVILVESGFISSITISLVIPIKTGS